MGQAITKEKQELARLHPEVAFVSNEHIFLKRGTVLDPSEFPFQQQQVIYVRKLARCGCGKHQAGLHEWVPAKRWITLIDTYIDERYFSRMCPLGEWTVEETLTEADIKELGLHALLPAPRPGGGTLSACAT